MAAIRLRVLTDAGLAFEEDADAIAAPGELGYLGILRNHAPLITTLQAGRLTWRAGSGPTHACTIGPGLLEIQHNTVTVLTTRIDQAA